MTTLLLINRRPHSGQFSIENIFSAIGESMRSSGWDVVKYVSPMYSKGVLPRLYNAFHVALNQKGICHIVGDVTYLAVFMRRRSLIVTFHDLHIYERKSGVARLLIGALWYRIPLSRAKFVTAISDFTRQALVDHFHVAPDRIEVIPNPIPAEFAFAGKNPIDPAGVIEILQIGTKANKNLDRVVAALEALASSFKIRLTIVGRLPDNGLLDSVEGLQIENRYDLSLKEIVELYQDTHLVMFASTYEGFGMPILEAQAIGRPVITSNIEPMTSLSGGAAQLVDPLVVEDIRQGVERLIEDAALANDLVDRGLGNAELYSVEQIARRYRNLYEQVG